MDWKNTFEIIYYIAGTIGALGTFGAAVFAVVDQVEDLFGFYLDCLEKHSKVGDYVRDLSHGYEV